MKPISLRFKCFGPYMEEQYIDFEELENNGLFLICGETGAGKTTILDAMCYALYGKSSGGLRGDISVMRCKLAGKDDETIVEFIFDAGGKRYKFVRILKFGRKKLRDFHNCMRLEDGNYVPLFENPKKQNVNRKAEEIIGLNDEQFRQVVILPQGQFERFLVSDSAEKETILVSLFKAKKWQLIAEEIYRRIAQEDQKLNQEMDDIRSRLKDYCCENIESLQEAADEKRKELKAIKKIAENADNIERECKKNHEQAMLINEGFLEFEKRRALAEKLLEKKEKIEEEERRLELSEKAEKIRPVYDAFQEARKREEEAGAETAKAQKQLHIAKEKLERVRKEQKQHELKGAEYEEDTRRLAVLERAEELYERLAQKEQEVQSARQECGVKKRLYAAARQTFEQANQLWLKQMDEQTKVMRAYTETYERYLSGISGTLAEKLVPGMPCPVCGSIEHPSPAVIENYEKVTENELDLQSQKVQKAGEAVAQEAKRRSEAEMDFQKKQQECQEAEQKLISLHTVYEEMLKQKVEGIDTPEQLKSVVRKTEKRMQDYQKKTLKLQAELTEAIGNEKAANTQFEQTGSAVEKLRLISGQKQLAWEECMRENAFETEEAFAKNLLAAEERNRKKEAVIRFRTELKNAVHEKEEQESKLKGMTKPDMEQLKVQLEQVGIERKKADTELIRKQQTLEKMQQDLETLRMRKEKHDNRRGRVDEDLEFAARLRGRSGISLQRYVLGVMLSSITVAANQLLKNVHGGRYQLYRTNEIAGSSHKGGLELEVLDAQSNERRSVTTLSGGEKFLVALSLAIGLSTVVQAQGSGTRLGAMFVDEGFGTLDQNSIFDALEVLQGIQKASPLVGIISHMEMLRDVIPGKLEVMKGKEGSYIVKNVIC